jgi:hypothetical protein
MAGDGRAHRCQSIAVVCQKLGVGQYRAGLSSHFSWKNTARELTGVLQELK